MQRNLAATIALTAALMMTAAAQERPIDALLQQTGVREGGAAIRDHSAWAGARKILVRDIGLPTAMLEQISASTEFVVVRSLDEALREVKDADAIVGWCDAKLLDAATRLVWVQIFSSGAEHCMQAAKVSGGEVVLTNMQKMSSPMIGEHAISMAVALGRNLPQFARAMDNGDWATSQTEGMRSIQGQTLLVAGLGGIGTEAARIGAALGMKVYGTRNSSRTGPAFVDYVGLADEMHALAAKADVIVNALPLTDSTRGIMDADFFRAAKPGAILINVGRGGTVVTHDLLEALRSGQISAAGLDVTDPEPLPADHPLWELHNVIVTPHVASNGGERTRHQLLLQENLKRYIAGERLLNVVDPEKGY